MGQPSMIRTMSRPARRMMRAGVCHRLQRNRFGSATASSPVQHKCWNQPALCGTPHNAAYLEHRIMWIGGVLCLVRGRVVSA